MDRNRLDLYLAELQDSLISALTDACPDNKIKIDQLLVAEQSSSSSIGRRSRQSVSSNKIDNKVSVKYRSPPPKPDFSKLTKYALGSTRPSGRKLEWGVQESMYESNTERALTETNLCPLQTTFLDRLKATNDAYFLKVKDTTVSVFEGCGSFRYP
jgi:hypothetical protein